MATVDQADRRAIEAAASIIVQGLSDGRRRQVVLDVSSSAAFQTAGDAVLVPFRRAALGRLRQTTLALALQASPTKEELAGVRWPELPPRQVEALRWVEGASARRWAEARWPGLGPGFEAALGPATTDPLPGDAAGMLAAAQDHPLGRDDALPELYGQLPVPRADAVGGSGQSTAIATRWTARRRTRRYGDMPIPVSGPSGERVTSPGQAGGLDALDGRAARRLGLPYPEWDRRSGRYLRDHVWVIEQKERDETGSDLGAMPALDAEPLRVRRARQRRQETGEVDVDALVDWRCDLAAGTAPEDVRLFQQLVLAPGRVAVVLLVDGSASSTQDQGRVLRRSLRSANALAAAVQDQGHAVAVFSFRSRSRERVELRRLKAFDVPYAPFGHSVRPAGYTRLGAALRHVGRRVLEVPADARVVLSLGDAVPSDEGYDGAYGRADVAKAVDDLRRSGVVVHHLVPNDAPAEGLDEMFGLDGWTVAPGPTGVDCALTCVAEHLRGTT